MYIYQCEYVYANTKLKVDETFITENRIAEKN